MILNEYDIIDNSFTDNWFMAIVTFIVANETEDLLPERTKATRQPRKYNIR